MNERRAETSVPLLPLLADRWSPVVFSSRPVEPKKLRAVLEAARWAMSSFNEQPWRYIVARQEDTEDFGRLASLLVEGNAWARHAPVLMLSVARMNFSHNEKPNRHTLHDVGAASALLTVQAMALGLHVHQMAGFDAERARVLLELPAGFEPVAMMALGYHDPEGDAPSAWRERESKPRQRRPLESLSFRGRWGVPLFG